MREIEFRGWDIENRRWVYGYYVQRQERTLGAFGNTQQDIDDVTKHFIVQDGFSDWNMTKPWYKIDVDPASVGQYTGKRDKWGKKIYENDIVAYKPDRRSIITVEFVTRFVGTIQVIGWNIDEPVSDYEVIDNEYEKAKTTT